MRGPHLGETRKLIVDSPNGFLNRLLKRAANTHNLTNTLHATAQQPADPAELLEIPARNLDNDVIQARLEACASNLRDAVLDFVERNTETKLSGDESERVTGSLRGEGRRTRQTSVNLTRWVYCQGEQRKSERRKLTSMIQYSFEVGFNAY